MAKVEQTAAARRKRAYIQRAVLTALAAGGLVAVTAMAPNALQVLGKIPYIKRFNERSKRAAARLAERGLVKFVVRGGRKYMEITSTGRRELAKLDVGSVPVRSHKKWDKRWRMIVFDIPEKRRRQRERLRNLVRRIGFLRVQDSVWIFPYDCEEIITLIKADMRIGRDILYAVVESIENDRWMRRHFALE